ncbi:hypothetical protein NKH60_33120 [Mesorhizobium sp. M1006]|uniref:hypothetical protein n=1 Tax=Mesorhizobium sp. M1006 TaxID=2957048 RepID=UPI003335777B
MQAMRSIYITTRTNNIVAIKALAHKLARACYHILKEGRRAVRCDARLRLKEDGGPASHVR